MQHSVCIRFAECVVAILALAMLHVLQQQQGIVEKYLLGFSHGYGMFFLAFAGIAVIPIEARDFAQINHSLYVMNIYIEVQADFSWAESIV